MEYICKLDGSDPWKGKVSLIEENESKMELDISGRGTRFHVIIGKHQYGQYICIPNHGIGCELAKLSDKFWNWEQLSRHLCEVDAQTVAIGLYQCKNIW